MLWMSGHGRDGDALMPSTTSVRTSAERPRLRVLLSLSPPDGTTRYVVQLVEGAPVEVSYSFFSWRTALVGDYNVFHVHWPEFLFRGRNVIDRLYKASLFVALLLRLKISRIPMVRTVHNRSPHEAGPQIERALLRLCDAWTSLFIRLNAATDLGKQRNVVTILHGHYKDRFRTFALPSARAGRLLYFGLIRPYKGVDDLLIAFSELEGDGVELRIVGKPTADLGNMVLCACRADPRISARLEFVADEVLVDEIGLAEFVVLPYREMENSGSLLVALSLSRAVVAPDTTVNRLIAAEVGPEWLFLYKGPLTGDVLQRARAKFRALPPGAAPSLEGRDWKRLGEAHYQAYVQAVRARRSGFARGRARFARAQSQDYRKPRAGT